MAIDIGLAPVVAPSAAQLRVASGALRSLNPRPLIGCVGDSISAGNTKTAVTGTYESFASIGYLTQAAAYLKGRVEFRNDLNFAAGGTISAEILDGQLADAAASDADIVCVNGGTNDLIHSPAIDIDDTIANMQGIYEGLLAAGKSVIALPIMPRSGWSGIGDIPTARRKLLHFNTWLRRYARTRPFGSFAVADADIDLMDWASSDGDPVASSTYDGLHPMNRGAQLIGGGSLFRILDRWLPPRLEHVFSARDLWHADNPHGALNANPRVLGSGGTIGTGVTGTAPDSWIVGRNIGSTFTAAASLVDLPGANGGKALKLELGGAGGGAATERIRAFTVVTSNIPVGERIYGEIEVAQENLAGVQYISAQVLDFDGTDGKSAYGLYPYGNSSDREPEDAERVIRTSSFEVRPYSGSGTQQLALYLLVDAACGTAPSGTIVMPCGAIRRELSI